MIRIASRLALLAIPVALGGCFVAAPADDYSYSYGPRPMTYDPPVVVGVYPDIDRHYIIEDDRVIVTRPRHYFTDRRYVREYRGRGRHRRWYDHDRDDD
jgi:hypothetical protein